MPPPVLRLSRSYHALCCALYTLVCIAWSQYAPQDLSSDQLTYHVYVAQAWWDGRLPHELLAASSQGYLNPLPHLPFWALFKADLPPRLIAALLAVLHSSNLWVLHGISGLLLASRGPTRMWLTPMAVLLGALTPMFAVETGSSLTDIIINLPSLLSVWAVLGWCQRCSQTNTPPLKLLWLGALAAGIATGLKPSAAFFSLTTAIAAMACSPLRLYPGMLWRMLAVGLVGFGISGGPHAWMLWHHFQSPVFPLFNRLFQAPLFPAIDLVSDRFRPASWQAGLDLLLNLHDPYVQTGFEGIAVDYRPAGLVLCAAVGLVWHLLQRQLRLTRVNGSFWLIILVFIPVWLYTSGNQRYALPAFMLLGPALALCLAPECRAAGLRIDRPGDSRHSAQQQALGRHALGGALAGHRPSGTTTTNSGLLPFPPDPALRDSECLPGARQSHDQLTRSTHPRSRRPRLASRTRPEEGRRASMALLE